MRQERKLEQRGDPRMNKIYVVVENYQGLTEGVHVFRDKKAAEDEKKRIIDDHLKTHSNEDEVVVTVHEVEVQ